VLDCRVYARAAAWIAGADRWSDEKWRDLEDQVGPPPAAIAPLVEVPVAAGRLVRGPTQSGRRQSTWLTGVDKGWLR